MSGRKKQMERGMGDEVSEQLSLLSLCGGRESQGKMVVAERMEMRLYRLACMITDTWE